MKECKCQTTRPSNYTLRHSEAGTMVFTAVCELCCSVHVDKIEMKQGEE